MKIPEVAFGVVRRSTLVAAPADGDAVVGDAGGTDGAGSVIGVEARPGTAEIVASFDGPAGAYVHVPFCEPICPFCPYDKLRDDRDLARRYFVALRREIDGYVVERDAGRRGPFTSLYVGGGTPTLY